MEKAICQFGANVPFGLIHRAIRRVSVEVDGSCQTVYFSCMSCGQDSLSFGLTSHHWWEECMKKEYRKPEIKAWGTVADLTATGLTNPGNDAKSGSVLHSMGG